MPIDPAGREPLAHAEDVLAALSGSETLALLGMTDEQLHEAHDDSNLLETLRIAHELILVLRKNEVLSIFTRLPRSEQTDFPSARARGDERQVFVESSVTGDTKGL